MQELLNIAAVLLVIGALVSNFIFKKEKLALGLFAAGFAFYATRAFLSQDVLVGIIWLSATTFSIYIAATKKSSSSS